MTGRADGSLPVTHVRPDNSAVLTYSDLCVVVGALRDAASLLDDRAVEHRAICAGCAASIGGACNDHDATLAAIVQYRALLTRLGAE